MTGGLENTAGPGESVRSLVVVSHTHPVTWSTCRIGKLEGKLEEKVMVEKKLEEQTREQEELLEELEEALTQVEQQKVSSKRQEVMDGRGEDWSVCSGVRGEGEWGL